ncbi:MAG: DUF4007 family protein [Nannocystis sp.]|nr:DUF4007 family protein [Nannocystis sp.]MBA3546098.1 DUF4007 family protein [Nannocystis sp.]
MLDLGQASFSGHETFAFRFSWLPKGVQAVMALDASDVDFFAREEAMVDLGVGKNMVKAIRHWCLATQLITAPGGKRSRKLEASEVGKALLAQDGLDPYLEDPGSLWLLHWLLATNTAKATTWRWAFGYWSQTEFTRDGMVAELLSLLGRTGSSRANGASLGRDVDTFLHTYAPPRLSKHHVLEDTLECPLVDLRLIRRDGVTDRYEFVRGPKPSLPDWVLGFAVLQYWERHVPGETLAFETLLYGEEAPGRVFGLSERSFAERVEGIERWTRGAVSFDDTAGMRQLYRKRQIKPLDLLPSGRTREPLIA